MRSVKMREFLGSLIVSEKGLNVGTLLGVPLRVQPASLLFMLVIAATARGQFLLWMPNGPVNLLAFLGIILFLTSLLAHEFGHVLTARRYGIGCEVISLTPFGMAAQVATEARDAGVEAAVTAAGPGVSIALALLGWTLVHLIPQGGANLCAWFLVYCNCAIALFNLVPCYPLDGGRLVRALAWHLTGDLSRATRIAGRVGMAGAGLLVGYGILVLLAGNPAGLITMGLAAALVGFTATENRARSEDDAFLSVTASGLMLPFGPGLDVDGTGMSLAPTMHKGRLTTEVAFWRHGTCVLTAPVDRFGTVPAGAGPEAMLDAFEARPPGRYPLIVMDAGKPAGYLTEGRVRVLGMQARPTAGI